MKIGIFLLGLVLCLCYTTEAGAGGLVGAPTGITDKDDPQILKAARFAVDSLNKMKSTRRNSHLSVLESVVKGTKQVRFVCHLSHRSILNCMDSGIAHMP